MKRLKFLMSVGMAAMITAAPLVGQAVDPAKQQEAQKLRNPVDPAKQVEVQKLKEKINDVTRSAYASALRGSNAGSFSPQITLGSPFWRNPELAKTLSLTADQQKKMEDVFQQHRLKLIDLNGSLAKEESVLNSLMADPRVDEETRVLTQIDRVAQARAELEKANARMLLGLRQVLTTEQWGKLSASTTGPAGKGTTYRF